jgi:hypothetical protein
VETQLPSKLETFQVFFKSFIKALELIDGDFEILLSSAGLKVVAGLSTKFFQKRAVPIISAFSDVLEIYQEEYERLLLQHYKPMSAEERELLKENQKKFRADLTTMLQRLNVKAQVLNEELKESRLQLEPETQSKLDEVQNITVEQVIQRFKGL